MLTAFWPQRWSRQQRSNATLVSAVILMVLALALLGQLLSFLPEPIGSNAQAFSDGARTTLWLTLISGSVGLVLGTGAALARTARWAVVRWAASFYIWVIRGTPLLVQILFVYFALPVLVPVLLRPVFLFWVIWRPRQWRPFCLRWLAAPIASTARLPTASNIASTCVTLSCNWTVMKLKVPAVPTSTEA
eukprot:gene45308-60514_t